jgi:hypothetical protein
MIRLAALDLVLWVVLARMMGVAVDLEIASTHAHDRAADAPRLRIPAHAIVDLEALRHDRRSDAADELRRDSFRREYLSA